MATKAYYLRFGSGNPATNSGLSPTFIVFRNGAGVTTPPSIAELSTTGIYKFDYECTGTVSFVCDGATTGLATNDRYVAGALDISDRQNEFIGLITDAVGFSTVFGQILQNQAFGSTLIARVGTTADVIGNTLTDPTTLYGYLKRAENVLEGRSTYTKATGVLQSFDKTGATTLISRTINDTGLTVTKT